MAGGSPAPGASGEAKVGLRTMGPDEMWHIDTTVIRLLDGTRAYLHAVIDNFSRRVLAWRVAETFAPVNSVAVLLEATRDAGGATTAPLVLADAGVENVNTQVDALAASCRRSSSVSRGRRPPGCRRSTRFSSIRYAKYLPLLAVQPTGDSQKQHAEGRDVDHGAELTSRP